MLTWGPQALGLGKSTTLFLPHRRKSKCVLGRGRVQATQKACLAWFPNLKLDKQGWGLPQTSRDPWCQGRGRKEAPIIPQVDMAVLLKVILK